MKLNLGCGEDVREGWDNYDMYPINKRVKKIDLNKLPLPFKDNQADYILMSHIYEHLDVNRYEFMREIHRITKKGGIVEIRVPSSHTALDHTMWFFPKSYFNTICNDRKERGSRYHNYMFKKISVERIPRNRYSRILDTFPIAEKLFPLLCVSELIWKLEKI